jgi:hypothetical protein
VGDTVAESHDRLVIKLSPEVKAMGLVEVVQESPFPGGLSTSDMVLVGYGSGSTTEWGQSLEDGLGKK